MKRTFLKILPVVMAGMGLSLVLNLEVLAEETSPEETPAVKLMNLMRAELEVVEGIEIIVSLVEVPPNSSLPKHYHPGEEFVYVLEGSGTVWQKGKPDIQLKQGDVFKVPLKQVHTAMTDKEGVKALVFRVHKKGEPERVPSE